MKSFFAPAKRAERESIISDIEIVSRHPVLSGLLHSVSGLIAILNEQRQILALNDDFIKMLGIDDPSEALGLRPGEAIECVHAYEEPAGCGTTRFCSTCGAAIAIVASLGRDRSVERTCALKTTRGKRPAELSLLVRSQPITMAGNRFLLLFMQDITLQEQRAALEKTFFHDINNVLEGLIGAAEMLYMDTPDSELAKMVYNSALRLKKEVEVQRCLSINDAYAYRPVIQQVSAREIEKELRAFFANHLAALNRKLQFSPPFADLTVKTDISLLLRVLCNMITNALEASQEKDPVRVWMEAEPDGLVFCVWNRQAIAEDVARRIFQRHFSTKTGAGRGVGTYSMKLLGEEILGGKVSFASSGEHGTVFRFALPG